jgi:hypothetical protein
MDFLSAELIVLKIIFVSVFAVFLGFSAVVLRQIQLMLESLHNPLNGWLKRLGWAVFGLAIFCLILSIVWL